MNEFPIFEKSAVNAFLNAMKVKSLMNALNFLVISPNDLSCNPMFFFTSSKRLPNHVPADFIISLIFDAPFLTASTALETAVFTVFPTASQTVTKVLRAVTATAIYGRALPTDSSAVDI